MPFTWTEAYTQQAVGAGLTLLGSVVGFISSQSFEWLRSARREKKAREKALAGFRVRILSTRVVNDIAGELMKLREYLLSEPDLVIKGQNAVFFQKYLSNANIQTAAKLGAASTWTAEQLKELMDDLARVKP